MTAPAPQTQPEPQRSIFGSLVRLALPVIGLNTLNVLALAVDTAMCGRLENKDVALAGLGYATQVVFLLVVFVMGLTVGTIALVARAYGARDKSRVNHVLLQSTQFMILVGIGVALLGNLIAGPVVRALGGDGAALHEALRYLRPLLSGVVFQYLMVLYAGILRGVGNTIIPFLIALASNTINFLINYTLILGHFGFPALGVQGAAIGTVTSYLFAVVVMVILLRREAVPGLRLPFELRKLDTKLAGELFRIGWPAGLDMLILNASFLSIVGMLGRISDSAVAAHGVGLRIQALAFVPGMSISQATGAMVGQALGAGSAENARKVTRSAVLLCTAVMSTLAITFIAGVGPIIRIFDLTLEAGVGSFAVTWIRLLGYGMPIVGVYIAFVGMLQGAGATNVSLRINALATLAFQIPLSWLLGFPLGMGAFGVWLAFPLGFVLKAGLAWFAYRRGHWAKTGTTV